MQLTRAIEGFVISRLADGYSPVTLKVYQSTLGPLVEFLGDVEVESITSDHLKAFMHFLRTSYQPERNSGSVLPLSSASHHRYWKAIRCFFKWASEDLQISRPDLELKMPKYTNREIIPLNQGEITRLLKACEVCTPVSDGRRKPYQCRRPSALRDRALLLLLLDTGVRVGECSRFMLRNVNLENGEITVKPYHVRKTRPRTVFLGKAARKAV